MLAAATKIQYELILLIAIPYETTMFQNCVNINSLAFLYFKLLCCFFIFNTSSFPSHYCSYFCKLDYTMNLKTLNFKTKFTCIGQISICSSCSYW